MGTNNKLGQASFEDHFNLHTKEALKGEYRILIVDGHDSHLTTWTIKSFFYAFLQTQLICSSLLMSGVLVLWLNLAQVYKGMISAAYTFGASYNIDKCEFLEIWHAAREKDFTPENVTSSWQLTGL